MSFFNVSDCYPSSMVNPYTGKSAQTSFKESTSNNAQLTSIVKLWAIRIFSDVLSFITQPEVLGLLGLGIQIGALCVTPVGVASALLTIAMNLTGCSTVVFTLISRKNLSQVSKFYSAKAELAKFEINSRNQRALV